MSFRYHALGGINDESLRQVQILAEKYSKLVPTIAYFDTGAHSIMMNPEVLPSEAWKEKSNDFLAADGQIFITNMVSKKKIDIQFFPSYTLWTHVIGTPLPDKDILIGWDIFSQSKSIRILPIGIRFKHEFKPFTNIPKIFPISAINPNFQQIQEKILGFCTNSHADFSQIHYGKFQVSSSSFPSSSTRIPTLPKLLIWECHPQTFC
ncbi:hypothetical protein Ddye_026047 [Dipteronia dyeriana]|uniref:Uncharacterized protein n=1 Tax=Dipteronia dyeriana TaxID=168575 RepID=A0AAD9WQ14_9ROSI|nr:hypothetical protein Ddye_026047 [Dipteronia dyeriana]